MRKLTLFALMVCLISLGACSKSDDNNQTANPTNNNQPISSTSNFTVNGVNDVTMTANDTKMMPLEIKHEEGDQEMVTLTVTGLPNKVSAKFSSDSGTPTFSSVLEITTNYAQGGSYPITITATTATGKTKVLSFTLKVEGQTNCRPNIIGQYKSVENCTGQQRTSVEIREDPDNDNGIIIPGDYLYGQFLFAIIDCPNGSFTITKKTYNQRINSTQYAVWEFTGSGTFDEANGTMTYTITTELTYPGQATTTSTCTYTLNR